MPATDNDNPDRYLVKMSEYAELNVPDVWQGWRNPIKYTTLEELGINLEGLDFRPMPPAEVVSPGVGKHFTYEVPVDAITITIQG